MFTSTVGNVTYTRPMC